MMQYLVRIFVLNSFLLSGFLGAVEYDLQSFFNEKDIGKVTSRAEFSFGPYRWMTAKQMQNNLASLTGFSHPNFDKFAGTLGRYNPATGFLSNNAPNAATSLILAKISADLAEAVVKRESFLDIEDRVVLGSLDLSKKISKEQVRSLIEDISIGWYFYNLEASMVEQLADFFMVEQMESGTRSALQQLLAILLQNGSLYFY